jgi:hypothetical protein
MDNRHLLKIKLKSLAAEARIIRHAERKRALPPKRIVGIANRDNPASRELARTARLNRKLARMRARQASWYEENRRQLSRLQIHRRFELRNASRATHLAYAYLRGYLLTEIEGNRQWLAQLDPNARRGHDMFVDRPVYAEAMRLVRRYGLQGESGEATFIDWLKNGAVPEYILPPTSAQAREQRMQAAINKGVSAGPTPPAFPVGP